MEKIELLTTEAGRAIGDNQNVEIADKPIVPGVRFSPGRTLQGCLFIYSGAQGRLIDNTTNELLQVPEFVRIRVFCPFLSG